MSKIRKLRLSRFFIFSLLGLTLSVFVFEACNKEIVTAPQNDVSDALSKQKILDAKNWFEKNQVSVLNSAVKDFKKIAPHWKSANTVRNSVELQLLFGDDFVIPLDTSNHDIRGMKKVLFTPIQNGYLIEILSYVPSANFKGDINKINSENILYSNFDGQFVYQNINSDTSMLFKFAGGSIIESHKSFKQNAKNSSFRSALCSTLICDSYNSTGSVYWDWTCWCNAVQISAPSCYLSYYVCYPDLTAGGPGGFDWSNYSDPSGNPKKIGTSTDCANSSVTGICFDNHYFYGGNFNEIVYSFHFEVTYKVTDCSSASGYYTTTPRPISNIALGLLTFPNDGYPNSVVETSNIPVDVKNPKKGRLVTSKVYSNPWVEYTQDQSYKILSFEMGNKLNQKTNQFVADNVQQVTLN